MMNMQRGSHLVELVFLVILPACSGSSSNLGGSGGTAGGDMGGTTSIGGTTSVGGSISSGGSAAGATGAAGTSGAGGAVGLDAGRGLDGMVLGDARVQLDLGGGDGSGDQGGRDGAGRSDAIVDRSDSGRDAGSAGDTRGAQDAGPSGDAPGAGDAPNLADACTGDICGPTGTVTRPASNTGTGFFVKGNKLYDSKGVEFRIRGVNKCHYDADWPGIPKTHSNTVRWGVPLWLAGSVSSKLMQDSINNKIVPMAGVWFTSGTWADADNVTCKEETAKFNTAVDQWVAQAATFKPFEKHVLINIANEWGPSPSTVWRDAYISAVARLRAAGYLSTLVIDSGGCGQDIMDVVTYGQAVFDSDPQRNIVFDVHIYGQWSNGGGQSWQTDLQTGLDKLAATGLPILIGEFGPGRNIGASPTSITPGQVITAAETRGMGWMAWAWDDPASNVSDTDFALSYNGDYTRSADLTTFGKDVVENATYGLLRLGQPATSF